MSQYRDNKVEKSEVDALRQELKYASDERRYGRWGAYRHSRQLYREQNQGYHKHYMNFDGAAVCTCGLEVSGDELLPLYYPNDDLDLEPMALIAGHRNLPSCEGITVALIAKFRFDEGLNAYLWTAYCQVCGKSVVEVSNEDAKSFVEMHNQTCHR